MPRRGRKLKTTPKQSISNEKPKAKNVKESSATSTAAVYSVTGHSLNTMDLLKRDEKHCDAVIEAGGEKFKIHKSVFAIYSDYFDKVFTVEMQEKYDNVVKLEDTRSDVMKCIIDFMYTGKLSINCENAIELLIAADYLRIEKIKEFSVTFLLRNVDPENCISVWLCARTYDLGDLLEKSATNIGSNLTSVAHDELCWLNNDQFLEITESTKGVRKSEEELFTAATIWANHDLESRKDMFCKIFQDSHVSLFSVEFLTNIARNEHPLWASAAFFQGEAKCSKSTLHSFFSIILKTFSKILFERRKVNTTITKQTLVSTSAESMHKIALELITRLEKASDEEEKAKHIIVELKDENQVSANRIDILASENKRLTERVQTLASYAQQAEVCQNAALRKIDTLTKELLSFESNAHQVSLQLNASAETIDCLTKENKLLTSQVQKASGKAQYAESHEKISAAKVAALTTENKRLAERSQRSDGLAQQAENHRKASAKKIKSLTEENELLTERVQTFKVAVQQHEYQLKTARKKIDELNKQNEMFLEAGRKNADHAYRADCQLGAFEARIERLTLKNKQLNEHVDDYAEDVEQAEDKSRELEIRIDKMLTENRRLAIQVEIETHNVQNARSKVLALEKGIGDYVKENQHLSALADNLSNSLQLTQDRLKLCVKRVHSARKDIGDLINEPSKSSWIWNGIYLSDDDKNTINDQLKQVDFQALQ